MRKITKIVMITVVAAFGFASCSKPGCTDDKASNFNADANEDDGKCTYRGDITFWCLPAVSNDLLLNGHTMLRFELEGKLVDSIATELFFAPGGECNTPGVKTIPQEEMPYEYRYYKYRVKGAGFVTLWEDFIKLDANNCLAIKLE